MPKHHPSAAPLDTVLGPWLDRALEIGGGLQPALRALAASMPSGKRQEEWIEVCDIVAAKDERLAAAGLAGHPENWIPLIAAAPPGATSGDGRSEVEFLSRAIDITTRDEPGRGWWRPAVYPLLVMATAIAISCLLAVMVVPTFKQIFNDFGMRSPSVSSGFPTRSRALGGSRWRQWQPWLWLGGRSALSAPPGSVSPASASLGRSVSPASVPIFSMPACRKMTRSPWLPGPAVRGRGCLWALRTAPPVRVG